MRKRKAWVHKRDNSTDETLPLWAENYRESERLRTRRSSGDRQLSRLPRSIHVVRQRPDSPVHKVNRWLQTSVWGENPKSQNRPPMKYSLTSIVKERDPYEYENPEEEPRDEEEDVQITIEPNNQPPPAPEPQKTEATTMEGGGNSPAIDYGMLPFAINTQLNDFRQSDSICVPSTEQYFPPWSMGGVEEIFASTWDAAGWNWDPNINTPRIPPKHAMGVGVRGTAAESLANKVTEDLWNGSSSDSSKEDECDINSENIELIKKNNPDFYFQSIKPKEVKKARKKKGLPAQPAAPTGPPPASGPPRTGLQRAPQRNPVQQPHPSPPQLLSPARFPSPSYHFQRPVFPRPPFMHPVDQIVGVYQPPALPALCYVDQVHTQRDILFTSGQDLAPLPECGRPLPSPGLGYVPPPQPFPAAPLQVPYFKPIQHWQRAIETPPVCPIPPAANEVRYSVGTGQAAQWLPIFHPNTATASPDLSSQLPTISSPQNTPLPPPSPRKLEHQLYPLPKQFHGLSPHTLDQSTDPPNTGDTTLFPFFPNRAEPYTRTSPNCVQLRPHPPRENEWEEIPGGTTRQVQHSPSSIPPNTQPNMAASKRIISSWEEELSSIARIHDPTSMFKPFKYEPVDGVLAPIFTQHPSVAPLVRPLPPVRPPSNPTMQRNTGPREPPMVLTQQERSSIPARVDTNPSLHLDIPMCPSQMEIGSDTVEYMKQTAEKEFIWDLNKAPPQKQIIPKQAVPIATKNIFPPLVDSNPPLEAADYQHTCGNNPMKDNPEDNMESKTEPMDGGTIPFTTLLRRPAVLTMETIKEETDESNESNTDKKDDIACGPQNYALFQAFSGGSGGAAKLEVEMASTSPPARGGQTCNNGSVDKTASSNLIKNEALSSVGNWKSIGLCDKISLLDYQSVSFRDDKTMKRTSRSESPNPRAADRHRTDTVGLGFNENSSGGTPGTEKDDKERSSNLKEVTHHLNNNAPSKPERGLEHLRVIVLGDVEDSKEQSRTQEALELLIVEAIKSKHAMLMPVVTIDLCPKIEALDKLCCSQCTLFTIVNKDIEHDEYRTGNTSRGSTARQRSNAEDARGKRWIQYPAIRYHDPNYHHFQHADDIKSAFRPYFLQFSSRSCECLETLFETSLPVPLETNRTYGHNTRTNRDVG
ncbi:unnamed protein product [Cyprideis torosa]|uniref:Uncharacterized protein n=1 Tax=Cyprideis torosa TaxID=163714 RepID=A0A7R8WQX9_9CRUS|nr:unnamed protein product [Cyprideis torosa]CAG0903013.1 unnamed protein product [Cyprideis torosa]